MDVLDYRVPPLRDYLDDELYKFACAQSLTRKFDDGEAVHARGDDNVRFCIVAQGAVNFGRFHPDGSFNLLIAMGPGSHFGDIALLRTVRSNNAFCVGPTHIHFFNAATLDMLVESRPDFVIAMWRCNAARLGMMLELYDDARTLSVTKRLAKAIHLHAKRAEGEGEYCLACSQRDLADLLGVSEVSIGNALKELRGHGLVVPAYRNIRVPDIDRLAAWISNSS